MNQSRNVVSGGVRTVCYRFSQWRTKFDTGSASKPVFTLCHFNTGNRYRYVCLPFPCTTMAPPPETAKDGINEKDPATALGEWYVPSVPYLSMRSDGDFYLRIMQCSCNKHLEYVFILSLTINVLCFTIIDDERI
jgi:hypothetical protein